MLEVHEDPLSSAFHPSFRIRQLFILSVAVPVSPPPPFSPPNQEVSAPVTLFPAFPCRRRLQRGLKFLPPQFLIDIHPFLTGALPSPASRVLFCVVPGRTWSPPRHKSSGVAPTSTGTQKGTSSTATRVSRWWVRNRQTDETASCVSLIEHGLFDCEEPRES